MGLQNKKKPCHAQLEGIVTTVRNPYIAGIIATMQQRGTSLDYSSSGSSLPVVAYACALVISHQLPLRSLKRKAASSPLASTFSRSLIFQAWRLASNDR